jgi:hypothetical protein
VAAGDVKLHLISHREGADNPDLASLPSVRWKGSKARSVFPLREPGKAAAAARYGGEGAVSTAGLPRLKSSGFCCLVERAFRQVLLRGVRTCSKTRLRHAPKTV